MLTIRLGVLRYDNVMASVPLIGMAIAGAVIWPGQVGWEFTGLLLVGLMAWFPSRRVRLEVSAGVVLARQGRWRGEPDKQMPRAEVTTIHYFPQRISFRGLDNKPVMIIMPNYTKRQMIKVAAELGVRLYDHTAWLGLRKVRIGQLAYDPRADAVPSTGE